MTFHGPYTPLYEHLEHPFMTSRNDDILATLIYERDLARASVVYVIWAPAASAVKIGIASDPYVRLGQLQSGNSHELRLAYLIPSFNALDLERRLHVLYRPFSIRGEWFQQDPVLTDLWAAKHHLEEEASA